MKLFITIVGLIFGLFISSVSAQVGVIETDRFDLITPIAISSSVRIRIVSDEGTYLCSGVVIKNTPTESIVLTAKHCVEPDSDIFVESFVATEVGVSKFIDIAYIKVSDYIFFKTPARILYHPSKLGDKILGVGYPGKHLYVVRGETGIPLISTTISFMKIKKGCSGGGIYNDYGELVGIMVAHIPMTDITFSIKLSDIHKFILKNRLL